MTCPGDEVYTGSSLPEVVISKDRMFIAKEILRTETTYVAQLKEIVEKYYLPLKLAATSSSESELMKSLKAKGTLRQSDIPSLEDIKNIFSNIVTIYELNSKFLQSLESMRVHTEAENMEEIQLGDSFLAVTNSFKFYSAFVNTYQVSVDSLERTKETAAFKELAKEASEQKRMQLGSLLVTPIQRIPRYLLLLQNLLKHTDTSHPDYPKLLLVLPRMEEVAVYINNEKSKFDNLSIILNLSMMISGYDDSFLKPGRTYIKEGLLHIWDPEALKSKKRYFFLFSDVLLMTRTKRGSFFAKNTARFRYIDSLSLLSARAQRVNDHPAFAHGIQVMQADGTFYMVHSNDKAEVDSWYEAFQVAIETVFQFCCSSFPPTSLPSPSIRVTLSETSVVTINPNNWRKSASYIESTALERKRSLSEGGRREPPPPPPPPASPPSSAPSHTFSRHMTSTIRSALSLSYERHSSPLETVSSSTGKISCKTTKGATQHVFSNK